jgi:isoleucyl-tRNA synthetase
VPIQGREIPVIADTYVDREFGTGALKITPGHDVNDYAIGKTHSLPTINILNKVTFAVLSSTVYSTVYSVVLLAGVQRSSLEQSWYCTS